jgi:hypothetical protein
MTESKSVNGHLRDARDHLEELKGQRRDDYARAVSIAITNIETAILWVGESERISSGIENELSDKS